MYNNDTHTSTQHYGNCVIIILLCEANRGGAKPFITLFAYWSERMLCSTYWNVDKNVYPHKQRMYIIYFFHDTQKIPRKIYALFACLKGEMIAMKKRFHIQNTTMFPIAKLLSVWMNEYVYNKTYGINVYKNQNLDI